MKENCVWQTLGFIRQTKENHLRGSDGQLGFIEENGKNLEGTHGKDYESRERMGPHGGN